MSSPLPPFGKYQPLVEIGSGGFAVVYRALDTSLEREVALKVLRPRYLGDPEFVARFFSEARTVARLDHPGIVEIYDVDSIGGRAFIAMQLAETSLASRLRGEGPLTWGQSLELLRPICEALDYAHGVGLIHRDLKPANILLLRGGRPLISDFGFARAAADASPSVSLSMSGGVLGTPGYIAPEIWDGALAGPPADRYALACIAYEMLTGQTLFQADTPARAVRAHVVEGPQFPARWPPGVPPDVGEVFAQALRREPERRFKSAAAFWGALSSLAAAPQAGGAGPGQALAQDTGGPPPPPEQVGHTGPPPPPDERPGLRPPPEQGGPVAPAHPGQRGRWGCNMNVSVAVTLAVLVALGGLGGLRLLWGAAGGAVQATEVVLETVVVETTKVVGATASPMGATRQPEPTPTSPAPSATGVPRAATPLPTILAAPTPVRVWDAEPPEQGRVLARGGGGDFFVAGSADKDISPAFAGEPPSCIQGIIVAPDESRVRGARVELARGEEVRRADHDHLSGTYSLCGLDPGDWEVSIAEVLGVAKSPAERAAHGVRFHTSGTPGEVFYISFRAVSLLPEPAAPLIPPPVASPRPSESYDGRWEGTFSGQSPFGPAEGRLAFQVAEGHVVYTESAGAPCAWADPDLRASIADGFSFAGLAVGTGVYYELAAIFTAPEAASGRLAADVGRGRPCLSDATWTAARVGP